LTAIVWLDRQGAIIAGERVIKSAEVFERVATIREKKAAFLGLSLIARSMSAIAADGSFL
jgi:hypothetical protein